MISLYSRHGRHKRIAKFSSWWKASEYTSKRWGKDIKNPDLKNYFFKTTKS